MSARAFTYPNLGNEVRVEVCGCEVRLIFVAGTNARADGFAQSILRQLKEGELHLTMMGKPTSITET